MESDRTLAGPVLGGVFLTSVIHWPTLGPVPTLPFREPTMTFQSRREFSRNALQSLTALALIDGLAAHRLFAAAVQPRCDTWFKALDATPHDSHDHQVKRSNFH